MSFVFERRINYYETDKMGVVHHSNYIRFLEEARCKMLDENNMSYSEYEKRGLMIPVLGANLNFKMHVTFDDIIEIKPIIKEFNGVRLTVEYNVINKKTGDVVLTGTTKHCFTDNNIRPVNLKKVANDFYEKFENLKNNP